MVIIMKPGTTQERIDALAHELEVKGLRVGITNGVGCSILGLVGDTTNLDADDLMLHEGVERVMRVQEPYKKANRKFHPADTVVQVGDAKIGGGNFTVIAGPCSVENEEQIVSVAKDVQKSGAKLMRGGAFKPRTSPYSFQGMGVQGLELLLKAKKGNGPSHCHRDHEPQILRDLREHRRRGADRRTEYAELRPFEGSGQDVQARSAQARPCQHL